MTPETSLKRTVKDWLDFKHYFHWPNTQGIASHKGLPDRFVLYRGALYGFEFKSKKGVLSEHQQHFKNEFENNGGVYIVVRSLEDVTNTLT